MPFVIKADVTEPRVRTCVFNGAATMYGGKHIGEGDTVYVIASETGGGHGLVARGVVTAAGAIARSPGVVRQTPRVRVTVKRTALAKQRLGRTEIKPFTDWQDGRPETELNFRFYRQATNKIGGISDETAAFPDGFF